MLNTFDCAELRQSKIGPSVYKLREIVLSQAHMEAALNPCMVWLDEWIRHKNEDIRKCITCKHNKADNCNIQ